MIDNFGVMPPELRRISRDLGEVSSRMSEVLSSLQAHLGAEGAVWGNDAPGHKFANGPHGYLAQHNWVQGSVDAKAALLDHYSEALQNVANAVEQTDNV